MNRGFTLVETLVYIALLGLIMGGVLMASYNLLEGAGKVSSSAMIQEEGNFVLRKINWALTNVQSINNPLSGYANSLSITKFDGTQIDIRLNTTNRSIEMRQVGVSQFASTTTSNVQVSALQFHHISGIPAGIEASTTINGTVFYIKKYLRK